MKVLNVSAQVARETKKRRRKTNNKTKRKSRANDLCFFVFGMRWHKEQPNNREDKITKKICEKRSKVEFR